MSKNIENLDKIINELKNGLETLRNVIENIMERDSIETLNALISRWSNIVDCLFSNRCLYTVYAKSNKVEIYFDSPYVITFDIDDSNVRDLVDLIKSKIVETFNLQVMETARILADIIKHIKIPKSS
ncbi:MAG: hypothetical protein QXN51_05165 [Ignisphaera sp.]